VTSAPPCKAFTQWLLQLSDSRAYSIQGLCVSDPYLFDNFRLNTDPDPGFDDQKLKKNTAEKNGYFLDQKLQFTYP
jgi:hypothetical protein